MIGFRTSILGTWNIWWNHPHPNKGPIPRVSSIYMYIRHIYLSFGWFLSANLGKIIPSVRCHGRSVTKVAATISSWKPRVLRVWVLPHGAWPWRPLQRPSHRCHRSLTWICSLWAKVGVCFFVYQKISTWETHRFVGCFFVGGLFFLQKFNTHFLLKLSWMVLGVGVLGSVEKEEVNDEHI